MEMARVLSSVHDISMTSVQRVLDHPVCSMLVYYSQARLSSCVCMCISFSVITHRSTVLSMLISNLINKYNSLTLAPNMPCMLLVVFMAPTVSSGSNLNTFATVHAHTHTHARTHTHTHAHTRTHVRSHTHTHTHTHTQGGPKCPKCPVHGGQGTLYSV